MVRGQKEVFVQSYPALKFEQIDSTMAAQATETRPPLHWVNDKNNIRVILDTKVDTIDTLSRILKNFICQKNRFIPHIYAIDQYDAVKTIRISPLYAGRF